MIRRRQEAERERIEAYEAILRRVSQRDRPAPDFVNAIEEAKRGFANDIVRNSWTWRPKLKTRDAAKLRLAAARHLFARYPVAAHLECIWASAEGLDRDEMMLRKRWYIVAAKGGSLYKAGANVWMTRKEVHAFLNPPGDLTFEQAFWFAIARSFTDDMGVALRIAHSKVARTPRAEIVLWREAVRFFCVNGVSLERIGDLCDFLADTWQRNRTFSLKGRTVQSLERLMRAWHRDLAAIRRIEAAQRRAEAARAAARGRPSDATAASGRWDGAKLADWSWKPSAKDKVAQGKREDYEVTQLVTAADLVAETRAMHHCVAAYASKCIAGYASIWSLRRRTPGNSDRLLTIELDRQYRAVQVRGFANRLAKPDEVKILERWAKARGVTLL
jgi:hypothetical protein